MLNKRDLQGLTTNVFGTESSINTVSPWKNEEIQPCSNDANWSTLGDFVSAFVDFPARLMVKKLVSNITEYI